MSIGNSLKLLRVSRPLRFVMSSSTDADAQNVVADVQDYYGKRVKKTSDLQTNVCTISGGGGMTANAKAAYKQLHEEVVAKYYGCGTIVPEAIEGCHVLDLGCGAGVDVYVLSKLVGSKGQVTGVDMTAEQLEVARRHLQFHADAFGFDKSNVRILEGQIEELEKAGVAPNSVDVIVSNCVINLAADKGKVLAEALKVLKEGGEIYFSDIYADKEVPESLRRDAVLWGECLSGALYWRHLHSLASSVGFSRPRLVRANNFQVGSPEIEEKLQGFNFVSATYRLFKLPAGKEEERGECQVIYSGEIEEHEESWSLDHRWTFPSGFVKTVDAETASILMTSRFKSEFEFNKLQSVKCNAPGGGAGIDDEDPFQFALAGGDAQSGQSCCPPTKGKCC